MNTMIRSLRTAILALIVAILVACTPGGTSAPAAPAASGGAPAPASAAPVVPGY